MISILIVDDHAIVRQGLRQLLESQPDLQILGEAPDGLTAVQMAQSLTPDVILLDLIMPEMDGLQVIERLRETGTKSRILVLTSSLEETKVAQAIEAGAHGYLLKASRVNEVVQAIRRVAEGQTALDPAAAQVFIQHTRHADPLNALSERERQVFDQVARGKSNPEIAAELQISEVTVRTHVASILDKLSLRDRTQVIIYALKRGLIDVSDLP